ncbi:MAG: tRNA (adenosine(37)-N6)-dimethylallyltransferase MiaA [Nitrospirae bacterium]|nr:tRNA (adenosine(37)-N6)-dimethylallyltransferase MiaA [Nitrospirota bacterium]
MNKIIILLGPTCVGKTGASILFAKALNTEIVSADSMQIYRHMDIGTAKPSPPELKEVRHHLINILEPKESFSAGLFRDMATSIINELHSRGRIPVIAGGTGLYIRTLTQGLFDAPNADWHLREKLMEEERLFGKGHLHEKLKGIDPKSAEKINPNDVRRTVRALEVSLKKDKPISELQHLHTHPVPYEFIKIGLSRDRKELYRLIEQRVDGMMAKGLVQETEELLKKNPQRTAMQSLGYKEISLYLNGDITLEEAVRLLKKRTKMYAKRQFTWFKKEPDIKWADITGCNRASEVFDKIVNNVEIIRELLYVKDSS